MPELTEAAWFGASWGAPLNSVVPHAPTPVGVLCGCGEGIERWASGVILDDGEVMHLECFFLATVGEDERVIRATAAIVHTALAAGMQPSPRDLCRASVLAFRQVYGPAVRGTTT